MAPAVQAPATAAAAPAYTRALLRPRRASVIRAVRGMGRPSCRGSARPEVGAPGRHDQLPRSDAGRPRVGCAMRPTSLLPGNIATEFSGISRPSCPRLQLQAEAAADLFSRYA